MLGFLRVLDVGHGRLCLHTRTGFLLGLLRHPGTPGEGFSEQRTGLDHLSLVATDREELLGHHLNFRDPDGIALEFHVPRGPYAEALRELRSRDVPDDEVRVRAAETFGSM